MQQLVSVRLIGEMAREFGDRHQFWVESAKEVFAALAANFSNFRAYLAASENCHVAYRVLLDERPVDEAELATAEAPQRLVVVPVVVGSGGIGKLIAGVGLAVFAAFVPFSIGLFGAGAIAGTTIGAIVALQGLQEILSPSSSGESNETPNLATSLGTVRQGSIIPVCFGKCWIRGQVISAGSIVKTF
jgi:predicted phage tail protein